MKNTSLFKAIINRFRVGLGLLRIFDEDHGCTRYRFGAALPFLPEILISFLRYRNYSDSLLINYDVGMMQKLEAEHV